MMVQSIIFCTHLPTNYCIVLANKPDYNDVNYAHAYKVFIATASTVVIIYYMNMCTYVTNGHKYMLKSIRSHMQFRGELK